MNPGPGLGPSQSDGPLVFVADLDSPELSDADRHHLDRVVRLRRGDSMVVSDGLGRWRPCRFGAALEPSGEVIEVPAPRWPVTVGFALVKGDRPELVVQKLTELGVDHIRPFVAERSVVRWDATRAERNQERLARVAVEAASQCRRCHLPEVGTAVSFADVVAAVGPDAARAERLGTAPSIRSRALLVGPEGGWAPAEVEALSATVGLAENVLRAETAAIVAGATLCALRAGIMAPVA